MLLHKNLQKEIMDQIDDVTRGAHELPGTFFHFQVQSQNKEQCGNGYGQKQDVLFARIEVYDGPFLK